MVAELNIKFPAISINAEFSRLRFPVRDDDDYFNLFRSVSKMSKETDWSNHIIGYSCFYEAKNSHLDLRLTCFLQNSQDADWLDQIITSNRLIPRIQVAGCSGHVRVPPPDTQEFRWFLCAATEVTSDLVCDGISDARSIMKPFCFYNQCLQGRANIEGLLAKSTTYRSFDSQQESEFWNQLEARDAQHAVAGIVFRNGFP